MCKAQVFDGGDTIFKWELFPTLFHARKSNGGQLQLKQSGLGICADGSFQLIEEVFPIAELSGGGGFE